MFVGTTLGRANAVVVFVGVQTFKRSSRHTVYLEESLRKPRGCRTTASQISALSAQLRSKASLLFRLPLVVCIENNCMSAHTSTGRTRLRIPSAACAVIITVRREGQQGRRSFVRNVASCYAVVLVAAGPKGTYRLSKLCRRA